MIHIQLSTAAAKLTLQCLDQAQIPGVYSAEVNEARQVLIAALTADAEAAQGPAHATPPAKGKPNAQG